MFHLAIAYPELRDEDREWIEAYREVNDPAGQKMAPPHFTFVFGIEDMQETAFVDEVRARAKAFGPIDFELKLATVSLNPFLEFYQEYLVPEAGYAAIVDLHDHLYAVGFSSQRRLDIPYVPHLSIGRCEHPHLGKERTGRLNARGISVPGRIPALSVVRLENDLMHPVATLPLVAK